MASAGQGGAHLGGCCSLLGERSWWCGKGYREVDGVKYIWEAQWINLVTKGCGRWEKKRNQGFWLEQGFDNWNRNG